MTTDLPVYDSAQPRTTFTSVFSNLWTYRGLLRLLVRRELTVRYKRSTLGTWWTLLNPLLTTAVLWLVFGVIAGKGRQQGSKGLSPRRSGSRPCPPRRLR